MGYLFFIADKDRCFETDSGMGTLGDHLDYLANYGGTPDCWDSSDTCSRTEAMRIAKESGLHLYVVSETMLRVVGEVNKPDV